MARIVDSMRWRVDCVHRMRRSRSIHSTWCGSIRRLAISGVDTWSVHIEDDGSREPVVENRLFSVATRVEWWRLTVASVVRRASSNKTTSAAAAALVESARERNNRLMGSAGAPCMSCSKKALLLSRSRARSAVTRVVTDTAAAAAALRSRLLHRKRRAQIMGQITTRRLVTSIVWDLSVVVVAPPLWWSDKC